VDLENLDESKLEHVSRALGDDELNKLVAAYYNLDFEDIISGGIKTRFKVRARP
jgi:hypothetical protein